MKLTQDNFRFVVAASSPWAYEKAVEFYDGFGFPERNNALVYSKTPGGRDAVRKYFEERSLQLLVNRRGDVFMFNPKICKGPKLVNVSREPGGGRVRDDREKVHVYVKWYYERLKSKEPFLPGETVRDYMRIMRAIKLATVADVSPLW